MKSSTERFKSIGHYKEQLTQLNNLVIAKPDSAEIVRSTVKGIIEAIKLINQSEPDTSHLWLFVPALCAVMKEGRTHICVITGELAEPEQVYL